MKILWITYDILNSAKASVKGKPTIGRSWIEPLFERMNNIENMTFAILTPVKNGKRQKLIINDATYYTVPKSKENTVRINTQTINGCLSVIEDFKPDLIHIHGTEINLGLIRKYVDERIPIVCSIQGIIPPCHDFLRQSVANVDYKKHMSLKNWFGRGGIAGALRKWRKYIPVEKEIFRINQYFIGRTEWDKAYMKTYNPDAIYYHGEEILRPNFYSNRWDLKSCERHRIFISSSAYALKGFHVLIKAAGILKDKYPDIKIVSPLASLREKRSRIIDLLISEDYSNYLKHEVRKQGLENNIELKQNLSAEQMAREFKKAHVFVLPSFLENSPNSLGEAMLTGTPAVVSPVGGVLSIVQNENSALIFPTDDYVMMAHQIDRLFSDDILACKISENAKLIAARRHHKNHTIDQYVEIYKAIVYTHSNSLIK